MLFGVGCDLCEIARMEQSLFGPHGEAFEARVFGEAERQALALDSCREAPKKAKNDHGDTVRQSALNVSRRARKAASAAADFAAKEAFLKAAGTGLREPFSLCEIEAVRLPGGAPAYHFSGRSAQWVEARRLRAHLSLSHEDGMAMAYCILETET
mgnify:CR=1 FL=1